MTDADLAGVPSEWMPVSNPHDLALLGKLGEEAGELVSAVCRCIIQGIDEKEPKTGKVNRQWLQEEIADVEALLDLVVSRLNLSSKEIYDRSQLKIKYKTKWLEHLKTL